MRLMVPLALAGMAAAGCGGPGEPSANQPEAVEQSAGEAPSACEILTEEEAAKALGREVEKLPASGGPAGLDICQYSYQGERLIDTGQATLTIQPVDLASLRKGVLGEGYSAEPVAGLGDDAFWSEEAGLYVGKGNRTAIYLVGIGGADPAVNKQRAIDLAKATVGRL